MPDPGLPPGKIPTHDLLKSIGNLGSSTSTQWFRSQPVIFQDYFPFELHDMDSYQMDSPEDFRQFAVIDHFPTLDLPVEPTQSIWNRSEQCSAGDRLCSCYFCLDFEMPRLAQRTRPRPRLMEPKRPRRTPQWSIYTNYQSYLIKYMVRYSKSHSLTTPRTRHSSRPRSRILTISTQETVTHHIFFYEESLTITNLFDRRKKDRNRKIIFLRSEDWLGVFKKKGDDGRESKIIQYLYCLIGQLPEPSTELLKSSGMTFEGEMSISDEPGQAKVCRTLILRPYY